MTFLFKATIIVCAVALCSSASTDKPNLPINTWSYDAMHIHPDSSYWAYYGAKFANKRQLLFVKLDSHRTPRKKYVSACFNRWPVPTGNYRVVKFVESDTDVAIYAHDEGGNTYMSNYLSGMVHVTDLNGKLHIWSNRVMMDIVPFPKKSGGCCDSTVFTFNLQEF